VPAGSDNGAAVAPGGRLDLDLLTDPAAEQRLRQRRLHRDPHVVDRRLDGVDQQEPPGVAGVELDHHLVAELDNASVLGRQVLGGDGLPQDAGQPGQLGHGPPVLPTGPAVPTGLSRLCTSRGIRSVASQAARAASRRCPSGVSTTAASGSGARSCW
jgi:hypothetical protein